MSDDGEEDKLFLTAKVANKWVGWAEAFTIFAKYPGDGDGFVGTDHYGVFAGPEPEKVTAEDRRRLIELGWRPDDRHCCFYAFT